MDDKELRRRFLTNEGKHPSRKLLHPTSQDTQRAAQRETEQSHRQQQAKSDTIRSLYFGGDANATHTPATGHDLRRLLSQPSEVNDMDEAMDDDRWTNVSVDEKDGIIYQSNGRQKRDIKLHQHHFTHEQRQRLQNQTLIIVKQLASFLNWSEATIERQFMRKGFLKMPKVMNFVRSLDYFHESLSDIELQPGHVTDHGFLWIDGQFWKSEQEIEVTEPYSYLWEQLQQLQGTIATYMDAGGD